MAQSPELPGLVPRKTPSPRTRIGEDEEWGWGLTVPRSEMLTIRSVGETLVDPNQVRPEPDARPRRSRRPLRQFATPSVPASEPPCAHAPNAYPNRCSVVCVGHAPRRRVGIQAIQRLLGVHLQGGGGRWLRRLCGLGRRVPRLRLAFLGQSAVALRHQPPRFVRRQRHDGLRPRPQRLEPRQDVLRRVFLVRQPGREGAQAPPVQVDGVVAQPSAGPGVAVVRQPHVLAHQVRHVAAHLRQREAGQGGVGPGRRLAYVRI